MNSASRDPVEPPAGVTRGQLVARGEAPAKPGAPRVVALNRERVLEFLLGVFEQSHGPQCVTVIRERLGVPGGASRQELAIRMRVGEIAQAQRRLHAAGQRLALDTRVVVPFDLLERTERLDIAAVREQQLRKLKLNLRGFRRYR